MEGLIEFVNDTAGEEEIKNHGDKTNKPMRVATSRLGEDAPEEYNRILPDTQGLNALMQENE